MIFSLFISLHILGMEQQTTTNPITLDSYYWTPNLNNYKQEATAIILKTRSDASSVKIKDIRQLSDQGSVIKVSLYKPCFVGVVIRNNNPAPKIILGIQLPTYLQTIEEAEKYMSHMLRQTR